MLNLKLFLFATMIVFSACVVIPTYNAHISLKPTTQNKLEVHIRNVLLVGTGPVASRVFLDNLSDEIIHSFKNRGIQSEFSYVGKIPQPSSLKLDTLIADKFDAYLVFSAANVSYLNMTKQKFTAIGPGVVGTGYGNQYVERYTITLYTSNEKLQLLWQGDLAVDFDIANNSRYKQISQLIFKELVKNHILL